MVFLQLFNFWAKPQVKKLLDKQINLLVFGGKWQLDNIEEDGYNEGILTLLLTAARIQKHFPFLMEVFQRELY